MEEVWKNAVKPILGLITKKKKNSNSLFCGHQQNMTTNIIHIIIIIIIITRRCLSNYKHLKDYKQKSFRCGVTFRKHRFNKCCPPQQRHTYRRKKLIFRHYNSIKEILNKTELHIETLYSKYVISNFWPHEFSMANSFPM